MLETLKGTITRISYRDFDTDYVVFYMKVEDRDELVTACGRVPFIWPGETVTVNGNWVDVEDFGLEFHFIACERFLPSEEMGMVQFLSSGCIKGVGPTIAMRIVHRFGSDTFDVIENHPEWLKQVVGISKSSIAEISESFKKHVEYRDTVMFFRDHLNNIEIAKLYKRYGKDTVNLVRNNPYILCRGKAPISFSKADEIAESLDHPRDSRERIGCGIEHVLKYNASVNGHTCLPRQKLIEASAKMLGLESVVVESRLDDLIENEDLANYDFSGESFIMTGQINEMERFISDKLIAVRDGVADYSYSDVSAIIQKAESDLGIQYADLQREALFRALMSGVTVITGGPGTGKTTVVKGLMEIFSDLGMKIALSAPTGRAAKRLSEATSSEAKTLHRLLEMEKVDGDEYRFNRNALTPLDEKVVIVDEASMIDLALMHALLLALPRGARLILIGDSDQLPSVGAGNILDDIITSGQIDVICLTEIFRQSQESFIVTNAHRINSGQKPILNMTNGDFFFVHRRRDEEIADTIASLIDERLPKTYGKDISRQIQVITPSKKGHGGVEKLNRVLQEKLNPPDSDKREKFAHGTVFRVGDKVMQTTNNYELQWTKGKKGPKGTGIFNGDIGVIDHIILNDNVLRIIFDDDKVVLYPYDCLDDLELAYAITVHKSQGSEYPIVVMPMYHCPAMLMTRNLLYTAVTRAKRMVIMVGDPDVPGKMVLNNREMLRYTTLKMRLRLG